MNLRFLRDVHAVITLDKAEAVEVEKATKTAIELITETLNDLYGQNDPGKEYHQELETSRGVLYQVLGAVRAR